MYIQFALRLGRILEHNSQGSRPSDVMARYLVVVLGRYMMVLSKVTDRVVFNLS